MSIKDLFTGIVDRRPQPMEIVGTIVDGPTVVEGRDASRQTLVFRVDAQPDLEFRQEVTPLTVKHRRGDRVRIHYQVNGNGVATVDWTVAE